MTGWYGPEPTADQRDVLDLLDSVARDVAPVLDDEATVTGLRRQLAELGMWTLGGSESAGGGGADHGVTTAALERLGRHWPALGWAAVQAHAAIDALADGPAAGLLSRLHSGQAAVAVIEAGAAHVRLDQEDGGVTGVVDRVDAASAAPHLLLLGPAGYALVDAADVRTSALRRTGLAGAATCSVVVSASPDAVVRVEDAASVAASRCRLRLGATAVAAGIAGAAADQAAAYTAARHQFGGPLTRIATVRAALLEQAELARTALTLALGETGDPVAALTAMRAALEAAVATTVSALQAHGGYGYLAEYPAERYLRDAISLRAAADVTESAREAARLLVGAAS